MCTFELQSSTGLRTTCINIELRMPLMFILGKFYVGLVQMVFAINLVVVLQKQKLFFLLMFLLN